MAFASLLSDEERTDDVVVLCLNYAGVDVRAHNRSANGYDS